MKIMVRPLPRVIVHAFEGEPVELRLYALDNKGHTAKVGSETCRRPIGLPVEQVLVFDRRLLEQLRSAYSSRDTRALDELYASAKTCLQYLQN